MQTATGSSICPRWKPTSPLRSYGKQYDLSTDSRITRGASIACLVRRRQTGHDDLLGLYSVPGWAPLTGELAEIAQTEGFEAFFGRNPYAEWYWNSMRIEGSPTWGYHRQHFGEHFEYDTFAGEFNASVEKWDPDEWGRLFKRAHVQYTARDQTS